MKSFKMTTDLARLQMKKMAYTQPNAQLEVGDYDKGILSKLSQQPELQPELFLKLKIIELFKHMPNMPLKQRLIIEWVHGYQGSLQAANKFIELGDRGELPHGWAKMLFTALLAAGEKELHEKIHLNDADLAELLEHKRKMGRRQMDIVAEIGCRRAREHQQLLANAKGFFQDKTEMQVRVILGFPEATEEHSKQARTVNIRELYEQPKTRRRDKSKFMVFIGSSGTGKSLLAKDLERNSINDGKVCFHIPLVNYSRNWTENRLTSVRELLLGDLKSYAGASDDVQDAAMKFIKDQGKSVYIIIDGISQVDWEVNSNPPPMKSLTEKLKIADILGNIFLRKTFPHVRLFVLGRTDFFAQMKKFPVTDAFTVGYHNMGILEMSTKCKGEYGPEERRKVAKIMTTEVDEVLDVNDLEKKHPRLAVFFN